jgi:hypothetical protein
MQKLTNHYACQSEADANIIHLLLNKTHRERININIKHSEFVLVYFAVLFFSNSGYLSRLPVPQYKV